MNAFPLPTSSSHHNRSTVTPPPLDHVTGLQTRNALESFLETRDVSAPLTVVLCDVVGLKATNDREGFTAGDAVLRRAADRLREAAAGAVLLARLGGDECVAVFTGADATDAAERTRSILAAPGDPPLRAAAGECLPRETIPAFVDRLYASLRRR
jgi:diguanylate cyclase (GGDEF)-like protein